MKNTVWEAREDADTSERKAFLKVVGLRVRKLRQEKQWTQEMLAQEARINDKYVYEIENGKKCMSIWVLEKVSKALGVEAARLSEHWRQEAARQGQDDPCGHSTR